ncbi:histone-lysine N-methyltransferase SETMAR-like [Argiope bruennichi]|uniref:histone-lysine N-methyltransferase SETMAR-like n=1 Tax=Argiope bruennichi TaxID=94029 RepID=UPI0024952A29|nr:histone-lysine N-methyltransferase SETMAR-like [Argiope bruennichi]
MVGFDFPYVVPNDLNKSMKFGYKNEYRQLYSYSSYYAVHFEKGGKAAQSFPYLNELFDEGIISECRCRELFAHFKSSETSLEDKPGRGRPSYFDDQVLLADIERDESLTTRMLFDNFNVDHSTIVRSLKKLGKVWKLAGWVPHELSDNNKAKCLRIFPDLLQQNERSPFLKDLVTREESWLLFKTLKRKKVCASPKVSQKGITKDVNYKKTL